MERFRSCSPADRQVGRICLFIATTDGGDAAVQVATWQSHWPPHDYSRARGLVTILCGVPICSIVCFIYMRMFTLNTLNIKHDAVQLRKTRPWALGAWKWFNNNKAKKTPGGWWRWCFWWSFTARFARRLCLNCSNNCVFVFGLRLDVCVSPYVRWNMQWAMGRGGVCWSLKIDRRTSWYFQSWCWCWLAGGGGFGGSLVSITQQDEYVWLFVEPLETRTLAPRDWMPRVRLVCVCVCWEHRSHSGFSGNPQGANPATAVTTIRQQLPASSIVTHTTSL